VPTAPVPLGVDFNVVEGRCVDVEEEVTLTPRAEDTAVPEEWCVAEDKDEEAIPVLRVAEEVDSGA